MRLLSSKNGILPERITDIYEVHEYRHALTILKYVFPNEYYDVLGMLGSFSLKKSEIAAAGGRKTQISGCLDDYLYKRGWKEKMFSTKIVTDGIEHDTPTHKIDCYKNRIALDIEWNNKDPFFDRDLNNYRLLYERDTISIGIIVTRCTQLQAIFDSLGKGSSYGASTTHMSKLIPRIEGGGGGGCPLLVFGMSEKLYDPNA